MIDPWTQKSEAKRLHTLDYNLNIFRFAHFTIVLLELTVKIHQALRRGKLKLLKL
jgi:hypothetical protein